LAPTHAAPSSFVYSQKLCARVLWSTSEPIWHQAQIELCDAISRSLEAAGLVSKNQLATDVQMDFRTRQVKVSLETIADCIRYLCASLSAIIVPGLSEYGFPTYNLTTESNLPRLDAAVIESATYILTKGYIDMNAMKRCVKSVAPLTRSWQIGLLETLAGLGLGELRSLGALVFRT